MGKLELTRLSTMGSSKGAFFVAEQLGLEQVPRQRRAVDLHEWLVLSVGDGVDGPRHHLLASATLTLKQDRGVRVGRAPDDISDRPHPLAVLEQ